MVEYHRKIEGFYSDMFIWIENFNEKRSTTSEDANLYGEWLKSQSIEQCGKLKSALEYSNKKLKFYQTMFNAFEKNMYSNRVYPILEQLKDTVNKIRYDFMFDKFRDIPEFEQALDKLNSEVMLNVNQFYKEWKHVRNYEDRTRYYFDPKEGLQESIDQFLEANKKQIAIILKRKNLSGSIQLED